MMPLPQEAKERQCRGEPSCLKIAGTLREIATRRGIEEEV